MLREKNVLKSIQFKRPNETIPDIFRPTKCDDGAVVAAIYIYNAYIIHIPNNMEYNLQFARL